MTAEEAEALARECGMQYVETSAKTGLNVDAAFLVCARDVKRAAAGEPLGHAVDGRVDLAADGGGGARSRCCAS